MKIYIIFSIIYSIGISQIYNDFNGQNKAANATNQSKHISNQEKSEWDITIPRGKTRQINFTTSEGTWMTVDVSPDGRWIVFDLLGHIYRMPIEGGNAECLTGETGIGLNFQPQFSPDGQSIAFISDRAGQNNLWVMESNGLNPRAIFTNPNIRVFEPTWSPDGDYIIVRQLDFGKGRGFSYSLFMYHREGGNGIELLPYSTEPPAWPSVSQDGRYVYFHRFIGNILPYGASDATLGDYQLRRLDLHTGSISKVTSGKAKQQGRHSSGGAFAPEVSPNGKKLAFGRRLPDGLIKYKGHVFGPRTSLWIRDLETGAEKLVMDPIELDMSQEITRATTILPRYTWMPDGSSILLSQGGEIRKLDVETGRVTTIPFVADVHRTISEMAYAKRSISTDSLKIRFASSATASPDGRYLAFQAVGRIWLMDVRKKKASRLTPKDFGGFEYEPNWSSDGRSILFTTFDEPDQGHVWQMSISGNKTPKRITTKTGEYRNAKWSPDGKEILVARGSGVSARGRSLAMNPWYELIKIQVKSGTEKVVARINANNSSLPHGNYGINNRIFFSEGQSLISVGSNEADRRVHAIFPNALEIVPSPDGSYVAFVVGGDIFLSPLPLYLVGNDPPTIDKSGGSVPTKRITKTGGLSPRWRNNNVLEFGSGASYSTYDKELDKLVTNKIQLQVPRAIPSGSIALVGARIITLDNKKILNQGTVVIRQGRISCIGNCETTDVDKVLNLSGSTIIPGFVDLHAHHNRESAGRIPSRGPEYAIYLAYGVTTTRDPAASSINIWRAKELVETGMVIGPRIFGTGETLTPGDAYLKADIISADEANYQAERLHSWGAESLKQYLQNRRANAQWIVDAGRNRNMVVTSEGGNFNLEHNIGLVMDGHAGFEHALVQFPIYSDVSKFLGQANFHYSPTVIVGGSAPWSEDYFFQKSKVWQDPKQQRWLPWRQLIPHARRHMMRPVTDYGFSIVAQGMADIIANGGYGTIGSHGQQHGIASHWEVWMYAEALGPMGALEVASLHGAHFIGVDGDIGSISKGKLGDLIVLNSNPLDDIQNTLDMKYVMKGGVLYDAATLNEIWPKPKSFGEYYWIDSNAFKTDTLSIDHWKN